MAKKTSLALTTGRNASALAGKATAVVDQATLLTDMVSAWREYKNTCEIQRTERERIVADRDVRITAIREQAEIFRQLISETFKERAKNFDQFFDLLNQGFNAKDDKKINAALTMIVEQTKVSPMTEAARLIQSINDPNVDCIEI